MRSRWTRFGLLSLAIVALAAMLRFWALDFGLPHSLARPDETPVVQQVLRVATDDLHRSWVNYPGGYIYLTWLWGETTLRVTGEGGYTAAVRNRPTHVYIAGRALSAAAGVAGVLLLVLVTRRELGDGPALLAGVLLATNFLHARDSHAMKPDSLSTLAAIAALAAMVPLTRQAGTRHAIVAGLAFGSAMALKYTAIVLLAPLYVAAVWGTSEDGWRRVAPRTLVVAGLCATAVFVATSHYLVFGIENLHTIATGLQLIFTPRGEAQTFTAGHDAGWAATGAAAIFKYHAAISFRYGAGILVSLLAPVALLWGLASRRPLPVLAAIYCLVHYLVVSLGNQAFARFMSQIMPFIALLEAGMIAAVLARLAPRYATVGLAVAAALLCAEPLARTVAHNRVIARTDTRVQAASWLADRSPPESVVAVVGHWPSLGWGMPQIRSHEYVHTHLRLDEERLTGASVDVLITHDHPLEFSTVPVDELARLKPRLELLAEFDPFNDRRSEAVFEAADAYYVPVHGFAGVDRPGPHIRVYAFQ